MKRKTTTATRKTTTKAKTKATPADATGAKLDALQSEPMIERQIKIHSGNKIHRFDIWGINETELQKAREHAWKLVKDQEQKNRDYTEANEKKYGTVCPSLQTCIFPPFPFVYEGPNEKKRKAWIVKAQADMRDWFDSSSPSRIISFIAVLGRAEAIKINLFLHDENLNKETIHLSPRDIEEISYKRWDGITFKTGFKLHLKFCKSERLSMQAIQGDTYIQQAIEEHFSKPAKDDIKPEEPAGEYDEHKAREEIYNAFKRCDARAKKVSSRKMTLEIVYKMPEYKPRWIALQIPTFKEFERLYETEARYQKRHDGQKRKSTTK